MIATQPAFMTTTAQMNIHQNTKFNPGISGLGQPNPEILGLEKWARIAVTSLSSVNAQY